MTLKYVKGCNDVENMKMNNKKSNLTIKSSFYFPVLKKTTKPIVSIMKNCKYFHNKSHKVSIKTGSMRRRQMIRIGSM